MPGWWKTPEKAKLMAAFTGTADPAAREKAWAEMQALFYEQVPAIKVGDAYSYDIASQKLKGMGEFDRAVAAFLERVQLELLTRTAVADHRRQRVRRSAACSLLDSCTERGGECGPTRCIGSPPPW